MKIIYMELNLENDLISDYIFQLHMFEYEHLFLVNQIIPEKKETSLFCMLFYKNESIRTFHSTSNGTVPLRIFFVIVLTCFSKR